MEYRRIFLLTFVIFTFAIVFGLTEESYDDSEDCYDKELRLTIRKGEIATPEGKCKRLECLGQRYLHEKPCPRVKIPRDCALVSGNYTKGYPYCCSYIKCGSKKILPYKLPKEAEKQ